MKNLVHCPCGHPLDAHTPDGCSDRTRGLHCSCARSEHRALDAAVHAARRVDEDAGRHAPRPR